MCEIGELTRICGAAAPGIAKQYAVDTQDVISIPSPNLNWTIPSDIILKPGKFWKEIPFVEQKSGLEDEIADAIGGGFKKSIPLKLAKYSPETNKWINNSIGARFIVALADNNGQVILVGDLIAAMRLEKAKGTSGQKSGDENGWDLNFVADGRQPCYFYSGIIALSTGGGSTSFDTSLTFASSNSATAGGVGATIGAPGTTSANKALEFNVEADQSGDPKSMSITLTGAEQMTVDYPDNYTGKSFRYKDQANVWHPGVFTDPIAAL